MAKTIYVGNLQWHTTPDELKDFFKDYEVESVEIIKDRTTGRAKGFAFVTLEKAEEALQNLQGKEIRGRTVKLNNAKEVRPDASASRNEGMHS